VAVTALEAIDQKSLKFPAKWIAYLTTATYVISVIGFYLNANWLDPALPPLEGRKGKTITSTNLSNSTFQTAVNSTITRSSVIIIFSTLEAHVPTLPDILNFGLIIAVLSTSNTSLYVASRTLYGLTQGVNPKDKTWGWLSIFSRTTPKTNIPAFALLFSAFAFCWVPFLRFSQSLTNQEVSRFPDS
jgi:amino acid transporter